MESTATIDDADYDIASSDILDTERLNMGNEDEEGREHSDI